jgi:hypothetical protein
MSAWTTLAMAKKQIGIPKEDCTNDDWLRMKLEEAEKLVMSYIQAEPSPPDHRIRSAIYIQFAELWRFRGDDLDGDLPKSRIAGAPSQQVERCLFGMRPPSLG